VAKSKVMDKHKKPEIISGKKPAINFDLLATTIFLVLALVYFGDFLSGKKMIAGTDYLLGSNPTLKWMADYIRTHGSIAFWEPQIFGGLPTVAAFFADLFSPFTLARLFIPTHVVYALTFVLFMFLAGVGAYVFLKEIGMEKAIALLGGLVYMFAGNIVSTTYAGHGGRMGAQALFPLVLFLLHRGIKSKKLYYFLLYGALLAVSLLAAHFQLTYYGGVASGFYFLLNLIWDRKENRGSGTVKLIGYYILGMIIMGGLVAIQFLPVFSNLPFAARGGGRGYEFAASWSLPPLEIFDLLTPNFSGILNSYWGENYFKLHSEYLGILPLLVLGIALILKWKNRYVKFFTILGAAALLFALGGHTPFYRIFYYILPGVNKFRAPSQVYFLTCFSITVLMGFGISGILQIPSHNEKKIQRYLLYFVIAVAVLLLLFSIAKDSIIGALNSTIEAFSRNQYGEALTKEKISNLTANYPSFQGGLLKTLLLIGAYAVVFYTVMKRKMKSLNWLIILGVITLFDQWTLDKHFIKATVSPSEYYQADEVINFLTRDQSLYRVHPMHYERASDGILIEYNIQSAGGYHPNPVQTYQDFIGAGSSVMFNAPNLMYKNFLDILNVKYIISVPLPEDVSRYSAQDQQMILQFKQFFAQPNFGLVFTGQRNVIYQNNTVLPRAFLVPKFEVIEDKDAVLNRLKDNSFNPRKIVILHDTPTVTQNLADSVIGVAQISSYDPNRIIIEAELQNPGFLVLSDNYHPDWKATIDGKPTKIYRAYHTFRAIYLESGKHIVNFVYASSAYRLGSILSLLACAFLVVVLIVQWRPRKKRPKNKIDEIVKSA
jgi:Bacterial membrane protein YfhO